MKRKVLIIGGTGTNGQELINQLYLAGIPARAMVRNLNKARYLANDSLELVEGDLSYPNTLGLALREIDIAYIVTSIHPSALERFKNFFETARSAGVKHIIKLSGLGANSKSNVEVFYQHGKSDELLMNSGMNYTILRPNSFFQNILWQERYIKLKNQFSLPLADAQQSLVDVRDIAAATVSIIMQADSHKNAIYNLTGIESLSNYDVADQLSRILNCKITYLPISFSEAKKRMLSMGICSWVANALINIQKEFISGKFKIISKDLESILCRNPRKLIDFLNDKKNRFSSDKFNYNKNKFSEYKEAIM